MKFICVLLFLSPYAAIGQDVNSAEAEWSAYWGHKVEEFQNKISSPLTDEDRVKFVSFGLFDYNPAFRVRAEYTPIDTTEEFKMKTSGDRTPLYKTVGRLDFSINGVAEELFVYRNVALSTKPGYKNYLFVPFTDLTNFEETYGGGRYLDLEAPLDSVVIVDFNLAYNPYCAYSDGYSCPIPPIENHLELKIEAGVLAFKRASDH